MKIQDKKQNTILFISSNTFLSLPPVKQLVQMFFRDFKIVYSQIKVKDYENFFPEHKENNDILVFEGYATYMSQSFAQKILKYWRTFTYLLTNLKSLSNESDAVVIYTIDLFTLCVASFLKRKNTKLVYHQFETLEPENMNKIDKFLLKLLSKRFDKVDLAILPEANRIEFFKEQINCDRKEKFFLLPNTNNQVHNVPKKDAKKQKTIVSHVGSLGKHSHLRTLLESFKILNEDEYELWFVGAIQSEPIELIKGFGLKNLRIIDNLPFNELGRIYEMTDIGIILYNDSSVNHRFCAPNKLYEYWSYGIPVIADLLPGLVPVFQDSVQGELIDMSDRKNITEVIVELSQRDNDYRMELKELFLKKYKLSNYYSELKNKLLLN